MCLLGRAVGGLRKLVKQDALCPRKSRKSTRWPEGASRDGSETRPSTAFHSAQDACRLQPEVRPRPHDLALRPFPPASARGPNSARIACLCQIRI